MPRPPVLAIAVITGGFFNASVDNGGYPKVSVIEDDADSRMVYDPTYPSANSEGIVTYPDIDIVDETVDMNVAVLMYKANCVVMKTAQEMDDTLFDAFA